MSFSENLKKLRKRANLSQSELATLLGINQYAFCDAEYICVGGIHMIFVPICEYEWKVDIKTPLSDMLKIVGILDYFLTHEYEKRAEIWNFSYRKIVY